MFVVGRYNPHPQCGLERGLYSGLLSLGTARERVAATDKLTAKGAKAKTEPVGQYQLPTALRRNVTGLTRASAPFVWNPRKT